MAETSSGVSAGYVDTSINNLRYELKSDIQGVQRNLEREIARMEREMREIGDMIVHAINQQTASLSNHIDVQTTAVVGGVAATTVMIERTKQQIADDFSQTHNKLDLQTESTLQIEVGKKISDGVALQGKLAAFAKDIQSRFQKSIEGFFLNRQLYNVNFKKIYDEYENKIKTIGEHIFYIRDNDIRPAVEASENTLEQIHSLPIEVDLYRLQIRKENLDGMLSILKSSRLDSILSSIEDLESTIHTNYSVDTHIDYSGAGSSYAVQGILTESKLASDVNIDSIANTIERGQSTNISSPSNDLNAYQSPSTLELIKSKLANSTPRDATPEEFKQLLDATKNLVSRKLISQESLALMEDFLSSGNLKFIG